MRARWSRAAAPHSRSWAAALSLAISLLTGTLDAAEPPAAVALEASQRDAWIWRAPSSARRIAWPPDPAGVAASEREPTGPIDLAPGEILLFPVDAGDLLRIDGSAVRIGFGSGAAELYPDVITWQSAPAPRTLRIPTWSFTRFLALHSERAARVRVQIAVGRHDALAAYRLDDRVYAWLQGQRELPVPERAEEQRRLLALSGLERLTQAALGARARQAFAIRGAGAWLAYSHWLEQSWMTRPLEQPFFATLPLESSGGHLLPREGPDGEDDWRLLQAGESLTLQRSPDWDVLSFAVRAQALGQGRVQLWRGNTLLHDTVFQIPRRAERAERWTPSRILRAVAAGPGVARLVVVEGRVRARVDARRAEHGAFESSSVHRPRRHRALVPETHGWPSWFSDLVAYEADPNEAGLQRLARHLAAPDTPVAAAGLLWVFALPRLADRASIPTALARLWAASASLPPAERSALFASVLERLQDTLPTPIEVASCPSLFDAQSGIAGAHEAALLRTQLEAVMAIRDGGPSRAALELEQHAARRSEDAKLREAARRGWQRAAPWKALSAPLAPSRVLQRRPFDVNQPSGLCQNLGARGLRWWIVPDRPTPIEVLDLGGTHGTLRLAPLDGANLAGSVVHIDGQPAHVQPILGEVSRVAVKPGMHTIVRSGGPEVIARIPRLGLSPCAELVETERWFSLERQLAFELPALEAATVASIIVDPTSLEGRATEVEIGVAGTRVTAWLRPPTSGEIEVAIPAGSRELVVRAGVPLLVRARVRMHPGRRSDLFAVPRPAPLPEAERIGEIARLTAALRASADAGASASLRLQRAEQLFALGYRELAALDSLRAGRPELGSPRSLPGALFLPDSPAPVVPLGVAARAPLLALADPRTAAQALRRHRLGQSAKALELLTAARLTESDHAEALLAALLAAEQGDSETAARTFERLARAHDNPALFEAAAEEYERRALETRRIELGRRAYLLAKLARDSATASDIVARFEALADWVTPSLSALGRDSLSIIAPLVEPEDLSIGQRVRTALSLPPPGARRLAEEGTFNVRRFRGQSLSVETLCHNREGPIESCQAELFVDGVAASCPELPASEASIPARCQLSLGPAARELSVRLPPAGRPMGWASLEQPQPESPNGALSPIAWQQSYTRLESEAPITLTLAGPGVLRIRARGLGSGSGPLLIHDRALEPTGAGAVRISELTLQEHRQAARDADGAALEVSPEAQFDQVLEAGVHEVMLSTQSGPLLIRPESMELSRLPDFEPPLEAAAPTAGEPAIDAGPRELELPLPASAAELGPFSASAELSAQDRDLAESDADASDRYVEMALVLRKELLEDRLWIEAKGLGRMRAGPASAGAVVHLTSSPSGPWPGLFGGGEITVQPGFDALGASANAGLRHRLPLGPRFMLLPEASMTWRRVDPAARARSGANNRLDNDVYSAYALRRAHSIDAKLVLAQRPFIDAVFRHAFGVRLNPGGRGLDRLEAKSELDLLPGTGWAPWLSVAASASHRPASELRQSAFTRFTLSPAATLWRWLDAGQRVRTDLSFSVFVDAPNPSGSRAGLFAGVVVGYDFLLGEGLEDYRSSQRPFRARLEEGGPGAAPDPAANDTYWAEAAP